MQKFFYNSGNHEILNLQKRIELRYFIYLSICLSILFYSLLFFKIYLHVPVFIFVIMQNGNENENENGDKENGDIVNGEWKRGN